MDTFTLARVLIIELNVIRLLQELRIYLTHNEKNMRHEDLQPQFTLQLCRVFLDLIVWGVFCNMGMTALPDEESADIFSGPILLIILLILMKMCGDFINSNQNFIMEKKIKFCTISCHLNICLLF